MQNWKAERKIATHPDLVCIGGPILPASAFVKLTGRVLKSDVGPENSALIREGAGAGKAGEAGTAAG